MTHQLRQPPGVHAAACRPSLSIDRLPRQASCLPLQASSEKPGHLLGHSINFGNLGNLLFISLLAVGPINFEGKL